MYLRETPGSFPEIVCFRLGYKQLDRYPSVLFSAGYVNPATIQTQRWLGLKVEGTTALDRNGGSPRLSNGGN